MPLLFEWDDQKATLNLARHGASLPEASTAFADPLSVTIHDPDHSEREDRYVLMGRSYRDRIIVVVHTERGDDIRTISARLAARPELREYEQG